MLNIQDDQITQDRRLADLEADTNQLEQQIINLETSINLVYEEVDELDDTLQSHTILLQRHNDDITALQDKDKEIETTVTDHEDRIVELENNGGEYH